MSTSGPRYHIPFPSNWLSVNTKPKKASSPAPAVVSPNAGVTQHNFLSNKPAARSLSMSSGSDASEVSTISPPASPPTKAVTSPVVLHKLPVFLALNSKASRPPTTATEIKTEKSGFLSNRH